MSFAAYYKLSSYCLVASGFLALTTTGALGPVVLTLFGCVFAAGCFVDTARLRRALPEWIWWSMAIACLFFCYLDATLLSRSLLQSVIHFLLLITSIKLLTRTTDHDYLYLYLLSFGALLAAAALTIHLMFLFFLILFLGAGISSFILLEMNRSSTRALMGGMIRPVFVPRNLTGTGFELFAGFPSKSMAALTLVLTVAILAAAIPLFFFLPRISLVVRHHAARQPDIVSGFAEVAELGALGRIKESDELVMKVKVDVPDAVLPQDLKWRGIALDHFDGRSWSRSRSDRNRIPTQAGFFKLQEGTQGTEVIVQTFLLQPIATDIVFGSHKVLAVSGDLGWLERDSSDNIYSLTQRTSAIRYSVVSDITRPDPKLIAAYPSQLPQEIARCCLQLPAEDPRVAGLARGVTAAAQTPYEKARALEGYLRTAYGYSLELKGTPNHPDPLAAFLFDVRAGHCEYFASAMAVMLRQLGIPARLINGFRAGTYNTLSGHWTVRQYDAHSWVEAWFPPYGWVEFDPTPDEPESRASAGIKIIAGVLDAFDFWWSDEVVNYDIRKQSRLVQAGREFIQGLLMSVQERASQASLSLGNRISGWRSSARISSPAAIFVMLLAAFILVTGILFRRRPAPLRQFLRAIGRIRRRKDQRANIVSFYEEALEVMQSRGWQRKQNQTPHEFATDLAAEPFGNALASLTAIYNRVRFGQISQESDLASVRELLRSLKK